jgi:hypothetical protein
MPYFVQLGPIASNQSGVGSRGYQLFRKGCTIITRWGPVEVRPGRRFFWVHRQERCYPMRSERLAREEYHRRLAARVVSYKRLPKGVQIR